MRSIRWPRSSPLGRACAHLTWCEPTSCCARRRGRCRRERPYLVLELRARPPGPPRPARRARRPRSSGGARAPRACARSTTSTAPGSSIGISSRETSSSDRRDRRLGRVEAHRLRPGVGVGPRGRAGAHLRVDPVRRSRDDPGNGGGWPCGSLRSGSAPVLPCDRSATARVAISRALAPLAPRGTDPPIRDACDPTFPSASRSW